MFILRNCAMLTRYASDVVGLVYSVISRCSLRSRGLLERRKKCQPDY